MCLAFIINTSKRSKLIEPRSGYLRFSGNRELVRLHNVGAGRNQRSGNRYTPLPRANYQDSFLIQTRITKASLLSFRWV
jgi:hypothetical protein